VRAGLSAAAVLLAALVSGGCASHARRGEPEDAVPRLRLAPSALPGGLAEQQRLVFDWHGQRRTIDALVEVDADAVRVAMHVQGQVALRFDWDGERLVSTRAAGLPPELTAERVLSDLQIVHWPAAAVQAALPAGWTFAATSTGRTLSRDGEPVTTVTHEPGRTVLRQLRHGYVLAIDARPVAR
jgi:hypothetical protein